MTVVLQKDNRPGVNYVNTVDIRTGDMVEMYYATLFSVSPDGRYLLYYKFERPQFHDAVLAIKDLAEGPESAMPNKDDWQWKRKRFFGIPVFPKYAFETGSFLFEQDPEYAILGSYVWAPDGHAVAFKALRKGDGERRETLFAFVRFSPGLDEIRIEQVPYDWATGGKPVSEAPNVFVSKRNGAVVWDEDGTIRAYSWRDTSELHVLEVPVPEGIR